MVRLVALLILGASLAGCGGGGEERSAVAPVDPAVAAALADPIMSDPDLIAQNDAGGALAASGPPSAALPPIDRSDEAIAAARADAARLAGGTPPPPPDPSAENLKPLREAVTAAQMALAARARGDCAAQLRYTAHWAAVLPAPLQVYPRGAVEEAAGSDGNGCALRVVHFRTPADIADLVAFYRARLRAAGYGLRLGADGEDRSLHGTKDGSAYLIYVRKTDHGLTAADIIVGG